jgi:hypothetical protein
MVKSPYPALPKAGGNRLKKPWQIIGVNEIWEVRMANHEFEAFTEASECFWFAQIRLD